MEATTMGSLPDKIFLSGLVSPLEEILQGMIATLSVELIDARACHGATC